MKVWKSLIRIWFTLASLASFAVGWIALAHSPKPNQFNPAKVPAAPQLDPVPSLDQVILSGQSENQNFFRPSQMNESPRAFALRSGGS